MDNSYLAWGLQSFEKTEVYNDPRHQQQGKQLPAHATGVFNTICYLQDAVTENKPTIKGFKKQQYRPLSTNS